MSSSHVFFNVPRAKSQHSKNQGLGLILNDFAFVLLCIWFGSVKCVVTYDHMSIIVFLVNA